MNLKEKLSHFIELGHYPEFSDLGFVNHIDFFDNNDGLNIETSFCLVRNHTGMNLTDLRFTNKFTLRYNKDMRKVLIFENNIFQYSVGIDTIEDLITVFRPKNPQVRVMSLIIILKSEIDF